MKKLTPLDFPRGWHSQISSTKKTNISLKWPHTTLPFTGRQVLPGVPENNEPDFCCAPNGTKMNVLPNAEESAKVKKKPEDTGHSASFQDIQVTFCCQPSEDSEFSFWLYNSGAHTILSRRVAIPHQPMVTCLNPKDIIQYQRPIEAGR